MPQTACGILLKICMQPLYCAFTCYLQLPSYATERRDNVYVLIGLVMAGTFLMIVSFIFLLIRNQNKLLLNQQKMYQREIIHQQELLDAVIRSQDEERTRIARDLHDDVGTALASLLLNIDMVEYESMTYQLFDQFKGNLGVLTRRISASVRQMAHEMAPPTLMTYGLLEAILELVATINKTQKIIVEFQALDEAVWLQLPLATTLSAYRIIQELLTNTIKHADATLVVITTYCTGQGCVLEYKDNGRGLDTHAKKGMGRHNILTRMTFIKATFEEDNQQGYSIKIKIPI